MIIISGGEGKIIQTNSVTTRKIWVPPPLLSIFTTQPAFIKWQSTICRGAFIVQSVTRVSCHMLWSSSMFAPRLEPTNQCLYMCKYVDFVHVQVCGSIWRGWQVLHQRWIWGIHCMQAMKYVSKGSTLAMKPRTDVTRSLKQGYSGPTKRKKDWFSTKKI